MSQDKKKFFDRHKKQPEDALEQTQAIPAVPQEPAEKTAEPAAVPAAEAQPKRNKYADKMNRQKSKLSKGMRIGIAAAVAALLIGGGVVAVVKTRNAGAEDTIETTAVVMRGDLETYIEGSGVTAARKREELGKDIKGKVTQVLVAEGDEVHIGDQLLVIDPTETRKELEAAQTELTEAQRSVTAAQADVVKAQSALSAAQKKVGRLNITAPFTGKLVPVKDSDGKDTTFRVGEQISEGQVIGYMVNDSQMKLTLQFSAEYAKNIQAGQTATVSIPSAMSEVTGSVSSVDTAQQITSDGVRVIRVVITVNNPGSLIKGMNATATISTGSAGSIFPAPSGPLEVSREEAVTAQMSGEITILNGVNYNSYTSGALIMTLSSDASQDEIAAAQNEVAAASRNVVSAQVTASEKQARVTELQLQILNSTIVATMDGVVVSLNAAEGQEVTGAETLVVVADLNDIVVNAEIPSTDVGSVQSGQIATMNMYTSDGSELPLTGVVDSVALEPTQNSNSGQGSMSTFKAVITVDSIEGMSIYSGMSIDYKITTASSYDCLMVPSSAIVNTEEGTAVFAKPLTDENGNEIPFDETLPIPEGTEGIPDGYQLVPVETGIADSTNTEIYWGIEEGTTVYLAGPTDLYSDMGDMSVG